MAGYGHTSFMRYPGGKGRTFRQIVNLIPPHRVYIETHLGGGAVLRHKRPAAQSIGVDLDENVVKRWRETNVSKLRLICGDALAVLQNFRFCGDEFVFCDPPYYPTTRLRPRVYRHDYDAADHGELLCVLRTLPCMVLITGYPCALYESALADWRCVTLPGTSHVGRRHERAWLNYRVSELHDYRYLGDDFADRRRIRRKTRRWIDRLEEMPVLERNALVETITQRYARK